MPPTKKKTPPRASEMSQEISLDYSAAIKSLHGAKAAIAARFPLAPPGAKLAHVKGKTFLKYTPTGAAKRRACLAALDRAAALLHELAKGAKVLEQA
jgi:hypothetical protein